MPENTYNSITINEHGILESAGGGQYVGDKKENISKVVLKNEVSAKKPVVTIIFAVIFCIIGLFGLQVFYFWIKDGGPLTLDSTVGLLVFLFLGLWLFWSALVPKTFIILYANSKTHKLIFRNSKDKMEAKKFVEQKCKEFDYAFESFY